MASHTRVTRAKRQARQRKAGRQRKNAWSKRSTPTEQEVFAPVEGDDEEGEVEHGQDQDR
jgi:hypothetical protein